MDIWEEAHGGWLPWGLSPMPFERSSGKGIRKFLNQKAYFWMVVSPDTKTSLNSEAGCGFGSREGCGVGHADGVGA